MADLILASSAYVDVEVAKKVAKTDIDTTIPASAADTKVPSTSLLKTELAKKANTTDLADVATSGSYTDLTDTPSVVDNVTSESSTDVLSAKQGKVLMDAISAMAGGIHFKGTVGTGGTIEWSALPAASSSNVGWEYKVITAHASNPTCNVGDYIISDGSTWTVDPSVNDSFEIKSNKVTTIASTSTNDQYPSALATYTELNKKVAKTDIDTSIPATTADTKVPSTKLMKTQLDTKIDKTSIEVSTATAISASDTNVPSCGLVKKELEQRILATTADDLYQRKEDMVSYMTTDQAESMEDTLNASISAVDTKTDGAITRITVAENTISSHSTQISTLDGEVDSLETRVGENETNITSHSTQISTLRNDVDKIQAVIPAGDDVLCTKAYVDGELDDKPSTTYMNTELDKKVDKASYTSIQVKAGDGTVQTIKFVTVA